MYSKLLVAITIAAATLLTGCVTPPTEKELASIDYGPYPMDHKKVIERHLDMVLKDPGSKQIEWLKGPSPMYNKAGPMFGGGIKAGYAVCAFVNARNSYGGYTGSKLSWFLINNDRVVMSFMATNRDSIETFQAEAGCKSL